MTRRPLVLSILGIAVFVLILAAIFVPHNMVSRVARNEVGAATRLRVLADIETRYAKAHPQQGYTCDFALLRAEAASAGNQDLKDFLPSDTFAGYKYSLTGCEVDQAIVVARFKATAVPLVPGKSGVRAFCIDQTMELRFGINERPETCRSL